jgi:hypothetical protein
MSAVTKEEAIRQVAAIESALREGFTPPGKRSAKTSGAVAKAALLFGIPRQTLESRVAPGGLFERLGVKVDWSLYGREEKEAALRGELGFKPVLPGFEIARASTTFDRAGEVERTSVTQKPERGPKFEVPQGHLVKGVSALVGPDGSTLAQWVKTRQDGYQEQFLESIKKTFEQYKGRAELAAPPISTEEHFATLYPIGDHHLGMYSWGEETGADYDVDIGERLLRGAMRDLVGGSYPSSLGIILSMGDFFHTDSSQNRTPESGHALDVDTRRTRVAQVGLKLMIDCVELALQKHERVEVRCLPGNHDPETTPWLSLALWAFFHANPRVSVDCSPARVWFRQFGLNMLSGTHGDKLKVQDLPMVMARDQAAMWGATRFRYGFTGHVHHKQKLGDEIGGVYVESVPVLPGPDSWHAGMGYKSGRSMTSHTFHDKFGRRFQHTVSVQQLEECP